MTSKPANIATLDKQMAPLAGSQTPMAWYRPDVAPFRLAGFPWYAQDRVYRRLPLSAKGKIPQPVDELANCPAGGQIAFRSNSRRVAVQVELAGPADMPHMPPTGQCGFDLYVGPPGAMRFHNVAKYDHRQAAYELLLFDHPEAKRRDFTLNFPLYKGVRRVRVGLDPEARVLPPAPWAAAGPVVIYGTSVTQGGCASRPGMAYTNILSRMLNLELVNLGFSGNGRGEPEVIALMAAIPSPCVLILDYEANADGFERYRQTLPANLHFLRNSHPATPILVVSRFAFAKDLTHADFLAKREKTRDMQAQTVADFRKKGDRRIHFFDGASLLGPDFDECTVDGVHPNDLGFMRMARKLAPVVRKLILPRNDQ